MIINISIIVNFFLFLLFSFPAYSVEEPDSAADYPVARVLYGESEEVCVAFSKVFSLILKDHIDGGTPDDVVVWEDFYKSKFLENGFEAPMLIDDDLHDSSSNPECCRNLYYKVTFDGGETYQNILIKDFSHARELVSSSVYILMPGEDFQRSPQLGGREVMRLKINDLYVHTGAVGLGVMFGVDPDDDIPSIRLPYDFKKNDIYNKYAKIINENRKEVRKNMGISENGEVPQRFFYFKNNGYIIARNQYNYLVYTIVKSNKIKDVCYISFF